MNRARRPWLRGRFLAVAGCLVALTAAAVLIPPSPPEGKRGTLLVLMPGSDPCRLEALNELVAFLGRRTGLQLRLETADDAPAFARGLSEALVTLCPDALALTLDPDAWQVLAAGRRLFPRHQRPVAVLVSRRGQEGHEVPWLTAPERTVFGDSLSLVCLLPLCRGEGPPILPAGVGWGNDPYDHRGVLAAAAHGAYDHAVVRGWEAAEARSAGWLGEDRWLVRRLGEPVPGIVLSASRHLRGAVRLQMQEALTLLGRDDERLPCADRLVQVQLGRLGLAGFNLLLGPDIERLRRQVDGCWPDPAP